MAFLCSTLSSPYPSSSSSPSPFCGCSLARPHSQTNEPRFVTLALWIIRSASQSLLTFRTPFLPGSRKVVFIQCFPDMKPNPRNDHSKWLSSSVRKRRLTTALFIMDWQELRRCIINGPKNVPKFGGASLILNEAIARPPALRICTKSHRRPSRRAMPVNAELIDQASGCSPDADRGRRIS